MKDKKGFVQKTIITIGILGIAVFVGTLLLCFVYMMPINRMQKHVAEDMPLLQEEGNYTAFWEGVFIRMHPGDINAKTFFLNNRGMARDNYTDAIMLGNAVYANSKKDNLEKALGVYRYVDESEMPITSLQSYLDGKAEGKEAAYSRYWHGYLVVLKPLLCIFTYRQIRIANVLLEGILFILLCIKISRMTNWRYGLCLTGGALAVFPFVIPFCMQYSTAVYVMLLGSNIYLYHINYWKENDRSLYYFMLAGIATSYVDFLTYPIITLGGLLVISVLVTGEKTGFVIKNSVMWCMGYFGMWFGKWITASIVLKENVVMEGFEQMLFRTSSMTETMSEKEVSAVSAVFANFSSMTNIYYIGVFVLILLFLIWVIKRERDYKLKNLAKQQHYLLITLYPIIWYAIIKNHSYDHSSFTYRALFVTVFAFMVMIVRSCETVGRPDSNHTDKKRRTEY